MGGCGEATRLVIWLATHRANILPLLGSLVTKAATSVLACGRPALLRQLSCCYAATREHQDGGWHCWEHRLPCRRAARLGRTTR